MGWLQGLGSLHGLGAQGSWQHAAARPRIPTITKAKTILRSIYELLTSWASPTRVETMREGGGGWVMETPPPGRFFGQRPLRRSLLRHGSRRLTRGSHGSGRHSSLMQGSGTGFQTLCACHVQGTHFGRHGCAHGSQGPVEARHGSPGQMGSHASVTHPGSVARAAVRTENRSQRRITPSCRARSSWEAHYARRAPKCRSGQTKGPTRHPPRG